MIKERYLQLYKENIKEDEYGIISFLASIVKRSFRWTVN
jgi:hypothetical protein